MKKLVKKSQKHTKIHHRKRKLKVERGALGAGMAYAVLGLFVVMAAASMMVGNSFPSYKAPESGQSVILLTPTSEAGKNNLQLYTFPGVTITLTPTPTNPPVTDHPHSGGNGNGNGPGGHAAPGSGGGGGGGSSTAL